VLPPKHSIIFTSPPHYPGDSFNKAMEIQPRIWGFYFQQIVWPRDLCADYGPFSIRYLSFANCFPFLLFVLGGQFIISMYNRLFAFGSVIFWLAMLPVSNLLPIYRALADRFLYLPMTGVVVMLLAIPWRDQIARRAGLAASIVAACALARSTFHREKVWNDSLSLWTETFLRNPFSANVRGGYAGSLSEVGRLEESLAQFDAAIKLSNGKSADHFAARAMTLYSLDRRQEAYDSLKKAVSLDERYGHPDSLVEALIWDEADVARLKVIAARSKKADEAQKLSTQN
jgi:tetratricopeptide (TPR) repeat protein